jgi:hypothetical protein
MFTPLQQHTHHLFNGVDALVTYWLAATHSWSNTLIEQPQGSFKLPDEYRVFAVLLSCLFGTFSVSGVGFGDGFKCLL